MASYDGVVDRLSGTNWWIIGLTTEFVVDSGETGKLGIYGNWIG